MKGRKCKNCHGKGFVFSTITVFKSMNIFSARQTGIQVPCGKCFGRGVK